MLGFLFILSLLRYFSFFLRDKPPFLRVFLLFSQRLRFNLSLFLISMMSWSSLSVMSEITSGFKSFVLYLACGISQNTLYLNLRLFFLYITYLSYCHDLLNSVDSWRGIILRYFGWYGCRIVRDARRL